MSKLKYTPDNKGMEELLTSKWMADVVHEAAERGVDFMKANAPAGEPGYRDSFEIRDFELRMYRGNYLRAVSSIYNDHPGAVRIDRAHNLFGRAVDVIEVGD